jgi:hypothetical protein
VSLRGVFFNRNRIILSVTSSPYAVGGAVDIDTIDSAVVFRGCTFDGNYVQSLVPQTATNCFLGGGAVAIRGVASVVFQSCSFTGNFLRPGGYETAEGGAVFLWQRTADFSITITSCIFTGNSAAGGGRVEGGAVIATDVRRLFVSSSSFVGNSARADPVAGSPAVIVARGGALYVRSSQQLGVTNVTFTSNVASTTCSSTTTSETWGGALQVNGVNWVGRVTSCVFRGNSARTLTPDATTEGKGRWVVVHTLLVL